MANRTVLITGATGQQGGSLLRQLVGKGLTLRAMTRKPQSDAAKAIAALGAEVVQGDLDDTASLEHALAGAWGAFGVQNTWEAGVEQEEAQGKRFAELAKKAGVQHFVYASVGSAHQATGIPHFDNKHRVEEAVRGLGFASHAIFRPVFFMENLVSPWFLRDDAIYTAVDPGTSLQMIAVEDIGRFVAPAFLEPARFNRREIDIAGDAVTFPQVASILGKALGKTIHFVRIPIDDIRKHSADFAMMLEWFDAVGYSADIPALKQEFGFAPLTLAEWAARRK